MYHSFKVYVIERPISARLTFIGQLELLKDAQQGVHSDKGAVEGARGRHHLTQGVRRRRERKATA